MNNLCAHGVRALLLLSIFCILCPSCINEEYSLTEDNLNLEVTPFEEGITLPLGQTDEIKLKELLKDVDTDILGVGENGAYGISFMDSFDVSEDLKTLKDLVDIPSIEFAQAFDFRLSDDVNVDDITLKSQKFLYDYDLTNVVSAIPDMKFGFAPFEESWKVVTLKDEIADLLAGAINDKVITVDESLLVIDEHFSTKAHFDLNFKLPKEIKSITDVTLHKDAALKVSVQLSKSFLKTGSIKPSITLDVHDLFHLEDPSSNDIVSLSDKLILSEENGYTALQTVDLASLALDESNWKTEGGCLVFRKTVEIPVDASISLENLSTTTRLIATERAVELDLKVEFVNLEITDYKVGIADFSYSVDKTSDEVKIEIPEALSHLKEINVYPDGDASIDLTVMIPEIGLNIIPSAEGLKLFFPEMLRFSSSLPSDYNYNPADNSITLHKAMNELGKIVLPIEKIVIKPLQDADGKYYTKGSVDVKGSIGLASNVLTKNQVDNLAKAGGDRKVSVEVLINEFKPKSIGLDRFSAEVKKTVDLDVISAEDLPKELISLGRVELAETYLNLSLNASSLPGMGSNAQFGVDFNVTFPKIIKVKGADSKGVLNIRQYVDGNKLTFQPIQIEALDFTGVDLKNGVKDVLGVEGVVELVNPSLNIDEWLGKDFKADFNASIDKIDITKLSGKVDYAVEPILQTVDLGSLAETLGGNGLEVTLDFNHAHLILEVETNIAVPVKASLDIIPYYEGAASPEKGVNVKMNLGNTETADAATITKYWLAKNTDRMPQGYNFVEVDILKLLKQIPEKLDIKLTAGTDTEKDCTLEPKKDYVLKANYMLDVPVEFGEDFEVVYRDTISDLPEIIGAILAKGNQVGLGGKITNSLPIGLEVHFNFLDSDKKVVPSAQNCGVLNVGPCNVDGTASNVAVDVLVGLQDGVDTSDIKYLEIVANANSGGIVGVPVKEDAYLQAVLQAILPKGFTLDVKDLINSDEK